MDTPAFELRWSCLRAPRRGTVQSALPATRLGGSFDFLISPTDAEVDSAAVPLQLSPLLAV